MSEVAANIGHNNPPTEEELLRDRCIEDAGALTKRANELKEALKRMPAEITSAAQAAQVTTYGVQLASCNKALEEKRVEMKKPFDQRASIVHNFFKGFMDDLDRGVVQVKNLLGNWDRKERQRLAQEAEVQRKKEAEAAAAQIAESNRLAAEAAALEQVGMKAAAEKTLTQAAQIEAAGVQAAQAAAAPLAPQKNVMRGSVGGSASSQGRWVVNITDIDAIDPKEWISYVGRDVIEKALRAKMAEVVKKLGKTEAAPTYKGFEFTRESQIALRT